MSKITKSTHIFTHILKDLFYSKNFPKIYYFSLNTCKALLKTKFLDPSEIFYHYENMRDTKRFFFPPFLAYFFSYFASALITVHLTSKEKQMKTEASKRRHGNEDRFTAHEDG